MSPERRDEMALRIVGLVVVGSLGLALAGLTWRLVGWDDGRSEVAVAETLAPANGAGAPGVDADVARIVSLAPFGGAPAGGLPASNLGLVLKGVMMAWPAETSTALISLGEGPAALYGVGQTPVGDAVIEAIAVDHVVLSSGGVRQRLDFPAPASAAPAPAASAEGEAPGAGIMIAPAAPQTATPSVVAAPPSIGTAAPASSGAASNTAPAVAGATGVTATGEGYRIGPNPSPELRRFGLQPGDVIETLNGQAVGDAASDRQLFERARAAGQARVVILREGRRLTVNLPLARSPA